MYRYWSIAIWNHQSETVIQGQGSHSMSKRISSESCSKLSTNIVLGSLGLFRSGRSHLPLMSSGFVIHNHSTLTDFQMIITLLFFHHPKPSDSQKDLEPPHQKRPNPPKKHKRSHYHPVSLASRLLVMYFTPMSRRCCTLPGLPAVAKMVAPTRWANCTATRPTPPVAAWISTRSPCLGTQHGVKWQGLLGSWFISWVILYIGCIYIYIIHICAYTYYLEGKDT